MRTHDEVLVCLVRWLSFLLPCTHKSPSRHDTRLDLRKMYLNHHTFLSRISISNFRYSVTWSTDFKEDFALHVTLCRRDHELGVFRIAGGSPCQVGLMFFALRVS